MSRASSNPPGGRVCFRLDASASIGSGHAMRCLTIARALGELGVSSVFAVSDEASRRFLIRFGVAAFVVGGDPRRLCRADADALVRLARREGCRAIVVDSYGITDDFDRALPAVAGNCATLHIDDKYTYELGLGERPVRRGYGIVVNYTLGATETEYADAYRGSRTTLLVGTAYAPVRPEFRPPERRFGAVRSVLITSGSTNPGMALERMAEACPKGLELHVVVGSQAALDRAGIADKDAVVHEGVGDLSGLMSECDVAVSAGGTTVLELLATGMPTVAVAMVDNQKANVAGLEKMGLGLAATWRTLPQQMGFLCGDPELRERLSSAASAAVDGHGAERIARRLTDLMLKVEREWWKGE